jgi:hypothetical protein
LAGRHFESTNPNRQTFFWLLMLIPGFFWKLATFGGILEETFNARGLLAGQLMSPVPAQFIAEHLYVRITCLSGLHSFNEARTRR